MKKNLLLLFVLFTAGLFAQPRNAEAGKCYLQCFDFNNKVEWKEVDCEKSKVLLLQESEKQNSSEFKSNLVVHQKMLQSKGYNVEVTGIVDEKTVKAHNRFLKKMDKEQRKKSYKGPY